MTDTVPPTPRTVLDRMKAIAAALNAGEASPTPTVREFLGWFNAMRRGEYIVRDIRLVLEESGLVTQPDFESAYIDSPISFILQTSAQAADAIGAATSELSVSVSGTTVNDQSLVSVGIGDPTYRLSKLAAANNPPVSVSPDRAVNEAVTLMLSNDFSQLPVMTSERSVKGMISWRSIGARWALDREGPEVRHFMDEHVEVPADRSIFAALPIIVDSGYVLVRDATGKISGIVTTSDLSLQFQQLAEPFLLLGEIENHIRRLMDGKFTKEELASANDPADNAREIKNVVNLSFGGYVRILQEPSRWKKLGLAIERSIFIKDLDAVRSIRNDVMHFDPDALPESDLMALRRFVKFLQALQNFGV